MLRGGIKALLWVARRSEPFDQERQGIRRTDAKSGEGERCPMTPYRVLETLSPGVVVLGRSIAAGVE